jgi:hypothetical protein
MRIEVTIRSGSYLVRNQPQKIIAPHSMGSRRLYHLNIKVSFFWMFFTVKFFTLKLMKIRWSSLFFGSFAPHFQIKLNIHGSNLNSTFIIMSELKFFLLTRVWTQNFKTVDLVKIFEKNQKLHILIVAVTLKVTSCRTMRKNRKKRKKVKKVKIQDSMGKTNFFISTLPFNPWAVSATWVHAGAPQKIQEK